MFVRTKVLPATRRIVILRYSEGSGPYRGVDLSEYFRMTFLFSQ